jgi:hypothetical protein
MNAIPTDMRPEPEPDNETRDARGHTLRHDGWTPDRQRDFLERIADGYTVGVACRIVGMTPGSAYALRRRAGGAVFALGWRAANLVARDHVAERLLARAMDGQTETITRADGSVVERHRYDNRLACSMLARLDREADSAGPADAAAARLIAGEFDAYLDLVAKDAGPARAGVFVAARLTDSARADLEPVEALARADRFHRTGAALAAEVDIADLDLDHRDDWTADQWQRAFAAGLLTVAANTVATREDSILDARGDAGSCYDADADPDDYGPVWIDASEDRWWTSFPPPDDFYGRERGSPEDDGYQRECTEEEIAVVRPRHEAERTAALIRRCIERETWFANHEAAWRAERKDDDADWADDDDGWADDQPAPAQPLTGTPAAASAACASATDASPQWKIDAASTADAWPSTTPATMSASEPTPPDATTGTVVRSAMARISAMS